MMIVLRVAYVLGLGLLHYQMAIHPRWHELSDIVDGLIVGSDPALKVPCMHFLPESVNTHPKCDAEKVLQLQEASVIPVANHLMINRVCPCVKTLTKSNRWRIQTTFNWQRSIQSLLILHLRLHHVLVALVIMRAGLWIHKLPVPRICSNSVHICSQTNAQTMALSYPEGECFFQRSALSSDDYHADNVKDFYSNMLIEFV